MKEHFLTILRDKNTGLEVFRNAAKELSRLIAAEIVDLLPLQKKTVQSPLAPATGAHLAQRVVLIPILRAGLVFLDTFLELLPSSPVGFLGIRRDETTTLPHLYYQKLPPLSPSDHILLLDPMLATGGTANLALNHLQSAGADLSKTTLVSIVAAPEGIHAVRRNHPKTQIYTLAVDQKLDAHAFIYPGLGDFGNRYFGTNNS